MAKGKLQRVCFTLNNYTEEQFEAIKRHVFVDETAYAVIGKEKGESGTPHLQGYINFGRKNRKTFATLKSLLFNAHIELAKGSDFDNQKYCSKDGDYYEHNTPVGQGKRSDLNLCVSKLVLGKRVNEVALEHPEIFVKYCRGMRELSYIVRSQEVRDFKTVVYVLIGPPGTGKSRYCYEKAKAMGDLYYKPRGQWWDGYDGQTSVIIDDFYGWLKYDDLLKLCDRYPYQVPIKGGYVQFCSKNIFITSNAGYESWYKFQGYDGAALRRRIEHLHVDEIPQEPITEEEEEHIPYDGAPAGCDLGWEIQNNTLDATELELLLNTGISQEIGEDIDQLLADIVY